MLNNNSVFISIFAVPTSSLTHLILRRTCVLRVVLAVIISGCGATAQVAPAAAATESSAVIAVDPAKISSLSSFVDGVVAEQIAARDVAGAVITVVYRGKVLFTNAYGYADWDRRIPVDPQTTMFRPGSVSKLFTWTALLQQVELGRVNLDADVEQYIDFKIPRTSSKPILVRDLMSHSAGFGDQSIGGADKVSDLVPYNIWIKQHIATVVREPGFEAEYSNYGAALAGYIVERASGEPFADYIEKHIFAPLGMTHTTFREPLPTSLERRMATGYKFVDGRFVATPFELYSDIMPAGSASTTAPDMARFMNAILEGGKLGSHQILSARSIQIFESDLLANTPDLPGMAHGLQVFREAWPRILKHRGDTQYQHSYIILVPEAQFGIFASMTGGPNSGAAREELVHAIIGQVFPEREAVRWTGPETPVVTGAYRSNKRDYSEPPNPLNDIKVSVPRPHAVITVQNGQSQYWEQIGPRLYQQVTGGRDGGPYDRLEFYGPADDPSLSFAYRPQQLYRHVQQ